MKSIADPFWIKVKGILFLILGTLASILLVLELPSVKVVVLLALAIWSFCRFYYFAFYVMEKYVDSTYRYSGLLDLARYLIRRRPKPIA
ncbi:MAG TPA: hypothetical protein VFD63_09200 [Pyrinomonadaceae bacterium]|nr:hypothetical protein [Pyrinomonadaceae bacterium]